jgi:hypothetical protein
LDLKTKSREVGRGESGSDNGVRVGSGDVNERGAGGCEVLPSIASQSQHTCTLVRNGY